MREYDICCIGHMTLDKVVTPGHTTFMPGGTAYYFAHAIAQFDASCLRLVTSAGSDNKAAVEQLRSKGVDVSVVSSSQSLFFENTYGYDQNTRTQRVLSTAAPFTLDNVAGADARIIHLGSLLAEDFSLEIIRELSRRATLSVDAQGYLRRVVGDQVLATDWDWKAEALPYIDILKVNELEKDVLTGCHDMHEACRKLSGWGVREVHLTMGSDGALIYRDGNFYRIPAYAPRRTVDATGSGDTYMAGYLYMRSRGESITDAGRFAAAMCTIKLEHSGPFDSTADHVKKILNA